MVSIAAARRSNTPQQFGFKKAYAAGIHPIEQSPTPADDNFAYPLLLPGAAITSNTGVPSFGTSIGERLRFREWAYRLTPLAFG